MSKVHNFDCRCLLSLLLALALGGGHLRIRADQGAEIDPDRPNIVIIFIDDMGYADIGPFGAQGYQTPHLDRMAREGRKFTDFHSATAVCSAAERRLLTGCYPERVVSRARSAPMQPLASTRRK